MFFQVCYNLKIAFFAVLRVCAQGKLLMMQIKTYSYQLIVQVNRNMDKKPHANQSCSS